MQFVRLTAKGERVLLEASSKHVESIERWLLSVLPEDDLPSFARSVRTLSKSASASLPVMP
ncbi:MAG: hypothetical protein ABI130_04470 [Leifsonia sp.]